jgi:hypothetical protein
VSSRNDQRRARKIGHAGISGKEGNKYFFAYNNNNNNNNNNNVTA